MASLGVRLTTLVVALCHMTAVSGRKTGAPAAACSTMVPGHPGTVPQSSAAPFTIGVSATNYTAGDTITVTITTTGSGWKGFFLQARRADPNLDTTTALGTFTAVANTNTVACSSTANSALTQSNADTYTFTTLTTTWTAPNPAPGHIQFRATFVEKFDTYWVGVTSEIVSEPGAAAIVTVAPVTLPTTTDNTLIDLSGCGSTKGCLRTPSNCNSATCDGILTWVQDTDPNYINFELSRTSSGWVALGLSSDRSMGGESVMECLRADDGSMTVSQSKNVGRSNQEIAPDKTEGLDNVKVGYVDGVQVCRFRRKKLVSGRETEILDITSTAYYLIIGLGRTFISGSTIEKTVHDTVPFVSDSPQDFTQYPDLTVKASIPGMVKAHGILMIFAWVTFAAYGMSIARHTKQPCFYGNRKLCGKDPWFPIHVGAMVTTFTLTVIGFILIFVYVGGFSNISTSAGVSQAHPIMGIIVTALTLTNPIMAVFRPAPDSEKRPIFNWAHWGVGTTARIIAIVTIFFGLNLPSVKVGKIYQLTYVMIGYVCFYAFMEITMEIYRCYIRKKTASQDIELKSPDDNQAPTNEGKGKAMFYGTMMNLLSSGLLAFGLGIAINIGVQ